jgi:hypothetical protein
MVLFGKNLESAVFTICSFRRGDSARISKRFLIRDKNSSLAGHTHLAGMPPSFFSISAITKLINEIEYAAQSGAKNYAQLA